MSQFRIKGIDYPDDSLEHGLGKGSGRGRPVGSKNGQVMPGAAYMKDYKIVGQKAVGDSLTPGAQNTQRTTRTQTGTGRVRTGNARGIETGGRGATQQARTGTAGASTVATTQRANNATLGKTSSSVTSTPASKVEKGKQALASLTGSDTYATPKPQRNRDMSTAELRALDPVGDWPWSNRRVNAAQQAPAKNADTNNTDTQKAAETPEQKSFWDRVGGWFNQAGKDIGDTAVGAWNATSKAVGDAANWVGQQMGPVGDWAQTAYNDVSAWVGDRGKDLNTWWNGTDEYRQVADSNNPNNTQGERYHRSGARENIENAANAVGQWIGNATGDVGQAVANAANGVGRSVGDFWNGRDVEVNDNGRWRQGHEAGMRENLGNAANAAGQWIGDRAQDVSNFINGVQPGTPQGTPYWDAATGRYVDPSMPSLAERIGTAANNAGQAIGNWWNGTDQTPGVREGLMNGANAAGQWIGNTANNVGQAVGNAWNGAVQGVGDFARNAGNTVATAGATQRAVAAGVAPSEIEQANRLLANGTYTPETYNNYVNGLAQIQESERAAAQAGWDGVPADVRALNERENWFDNNIVAPVTNAANGAGDFVRNSVNNVGQAFGNSANAAGQWIGNTANNVGQAVGNAANAAGQWVGNAANDVGRWAGEAAKNARDTANVTGLTGRAIAAGVPVDLATRWVQNYNNGQITPSEFEDLLDRWTSNNR